MKEIAPKVWTWAPQWHWYGWRTLLPVYFGGDEYERHTVVIGWTVTGRVIFAVSKEGQRRLKSMQAWLFESTQRDSGDPQ